ncbi:uncharacterized protein BJ212DRAFT_1306588 [Suillus subaureus]|uniref:Uncharacterized protein n=1 Tax=Suillus subaureus TaxID=48587 RepID=A0A9P7AS94_9AGAM|nr:uncharacterized protein BJ212DRAFT_1306588 [Suillus subaureus]KAG1795507.1 hypothetical protein BJ212DRAFT_1306588 [Suillus subaureus]
MACTGKTHVVKRVHPQLTTSQKVTCREKFVSITNDINDTQASYMDKVQGLAKKHGQSEHWTWHQLYLGRKIVCCQHAPNAWNRFVCQHLNDINEGLSCGDCWKLTEFVEDHKENLKHDYSKLTAAQKNAFVNQVMKKSIKNQKIVCDNPKAMQCNMLTSFAAMDQEWTALSVQGGIEDLSGPKLFFSEKAEKFARAVLDLEPQHLALKLEAFVVLGLDTNVSTTQPHSLNKMISKCRTHLQDELDYILQENKITNCKITMNYTNYKCSIVDRYGVTLQGWPSALLPV